MDLIFRILTTADSGPSITWKLPSVAPCGFSHSFRAAPLAVLLSLRSFYSSSPCSPLTLHSSPRSAVSSFRHYPPPQRKKLNPVYFKSSQAGCDWFHFTLKSLRPIEWAQRRKLAYRVYRFALIPLVASFSLYPFTLVLLPFSKPPLSRSSSCHPYTQLCKTRLFFTRSRV